MFLSVAFTGNYKVSRHAARGMRFNHMVEGSSGGLPVGANIVDALYFFWIFRLMSSNSQTKFRVIDSEGRNYMQLTMSRAEKYWLRMRKRMKQWNCVRQRFLKIILLTSQYFAYIYGENWTPTLYNNDMLY